MQIEPNIVIFDTTQHSIEHPFSPEGTLYTSYLSETPSALHYHDFFEIGYSEHGTGIFNVGGEPIPFHGPSCSIIYPGLAHIAQSAGGDRSLWHFLYIDLRLLFAGGSFADSSFLRELPAERWQNYDYPSILSQADYPEFYEIIRQIMAETSSLKPGALDVVRGLVFSLLRMHERLFLPLEGADGDEARDTRLYLMKELEPALNFIIEHYAEKIEIEDLVSVSRLSKSNLQRKMIALTGHAPLQYVHFIRLRHACAQLLDPKNSISDIAGSVGYNLSSFNRQFRKEFGISPSEWRKTGR